MVILISNGEQWTREHDSNFDVTMGSYGVPKPAN